MTIRELKRPNITAKDSSLVVELPFAECNLISKALIAFEKISDCSDEERFFIWQFRTVKHILTDGNIDSLDCDLFHSKFRENRNDRERTA